MEKNVVLKDPKGLVEKDLTTVYKALETTIPQAIPAVLATFKRKEEYTQSNKSLLKHKIETLTGKTIALIMEEMDYIPENPNQTGMDLDTMKLLAHYLILYSNGAPLIQVSKKSNRSPGILSPPTKGYMESTRIESPTRKTKSTPNKSPRKILESRNTSTCQEDSSDDDQPSGKVIQTEPVLKEKYESNSCGTLVLVILVGVIVAILSGLYFSEELWPQTIPAPSADHWNVARRTFTTRLRGLKSSLPNQSTRLWSVVSAAVKQTLRPRPEYPAVVLLVAPRSAEHAATCLAARLAGVAEEVLGGAGGGKVVKMVDIAEAGEGGRREGLANHLHSALSRSKAAALLGLENLDPDAAMTLHAFADNVNAPYKQAVMVLTLLEDGDQGGKKFRNGEEAAERLLAGAWGDQLGDDKLYPIISRVAVNVAMVEQEEKEVVKGLCP